MSPFPKRIALTVAVAAIGALTLPQAASAIVDQDVEGSTLTVTSDDAADSIVLATAGGVITVNGAATTLAANENAQIAVVAGGGNDTIDASALAVSAYRDLVLNGGDGDDLMTGGADNDRLDGDAGDDRLIGFRGGDQVAGDAGNDAMVWNNGDGTDTNDGETGNDEVEVNGAPTLGDQLTARPGDVAGRVQFNRTNLNQFGIDFTAERLTVNGLGGDDAFAPGAVGLAGLTALTVNGGPGGDTITGGDGADLLTGGDGSDLLDGGAGDDRVVGDRGTDFHRGGTGDDALVWNNGDGTDEMAGEAGFDRVQVNGASAGDVFTLTPGQEAARFQRTNLVPFALTILPTAEEVDLNSGGGNDDLTVAPGLGALAVSADGGSGDDDLIGREEEDTFFGGTGADTVVGGGGTDVVDGGADADNLFAQDDVGDLVRGGAGIDRAETDSIEIDVVDGVENLLAEPVDREGIPPELGEIEVVRRSGELTALVPLTCPAAETGGCAIDLSLETARPVRIGGVRAVVVLGTGAAELAGGEQGTVRVPLAPGTSRLADDGKLRARTRVSSVDAAGNLSQLSTAVELRIPRN